MAARLGQFPGALERALPTVFLDAEQELFHSGNKIRRVIEHAIVIAGEFPKEFGFFGCREVFLGMMKFNKLIPVAVHDHYWDG